MSRSDNRYPINPCAVLVALAVTTLLTLDIFAAGTNVARWNLGEQDAGALAGNPANATTTEVVAAADLNNAGGAPIYSADVPSGGSTLSIDLPSGAYFTSPNVTVISSLNLNDFSISFDAKPTSDGPFPTAICIGRYGNGAAFIYHTGGTWRFHIGGAGDQMSIARTLNAWQHIDYVRQGGVNKLFVDGVQAAGTTTTAYTPSSDFTIGVPINGAGSPDTGGHFIGLIDNVVISNNISDGLPPTITGLSVTPGKIYAGNSIILSPVGFAGDTAGLGFIARSNGVPFAFSTNAPIFKNGVTTNDSANYDLVVTNNSGAVTSSIVVVTVLPSAGADVMRFRMGDNDPGAVAGNLGNPQTLDAILGNNLDFSGSPAYSNNVPVGGGALSMSFDGGSFYRNTNLTSFLANLDQNNYSLSFDIYVRNLGGSGFSFPLTLGKNGGGIGLVEIGGTWQFYRMGVGGVVLPNQIPLNTWTHFEIQRRDFDGTVRLRCFVNGQDQNFQGTAYTVAGPILTTGANTTGDGEGVEGFFDGMIDNVVIRNYSVGALPTIISGPTAEPGAVLAANEALTLSVTMSGGTPVGYFWRRNGTVVTNEVTGTTSTVTFANPLPGNYDVIVSNSPLGVVTSSIVAVSIDARTDSPFSLKATYNLGENDPGAVNGGNVGTTTRQADGVKDLARYGASTYTNFVPPGGSTLAIALNGSTDRFNDESSRMTNWFNGAFNPDNFAMSCDVYPTGDGAQGFSVAMCIGRGGNNYFIYHAGGTWFVHKNGSGNIITGPAVTLNAWSHLELKRADFGGGLETKLFVNDVEAGSTFVPANPTPGFTIGSNRRNVPLTDPSPFEGPFLGYVDNAVLQTFPPVLSLLVSGGTASANLTGGKVSTLYRLERTTSLVAPVIWSTVDTQTTDINGTVALNDAAPPTVQAFYRAVTP